MSFKFTYFRMFVLRYLNLWKKNIFSIGIAFIIKYVSSHIKYKCMVDALYPDINHLTTRMTMK